MNEDTLVAVHCYAGDAEQVVRAMPEYLHHNCPVLVLSPSDAPVQIDGVLNRMAGRRAYTGQVSVDRERAHLEILLEYPQSHFLLHDSDSVCLSPDLPSYLYAEPETLFYNATPTHRFIWAQGSDPVHHATYARFPEVFQPPLFFSRDTLERMLAVSDDAMASLPRWALLIDWYFAAMAQEAEIRTRAFPDGISRPIWSLYEVARVYASVRTCGTTMLHSIKTREVLDVMASAFAEYNADPTARDLCRSW